MEDMCRKIAEKLLKEESLDINEAEHLKNCSECCKTNSETGIMLSDLKKLNIDTLTKDGVTLCDSVMNEVRRQALFGTNKKTGFMRHAGLIVACVAICILAFPFISNYINGEKEANPVALDGGVASEQATEGINETAVARGSDTAGRADVPETYFTEADTAEKYGENGSITITANDKSNLDNEKSPDDANVPVNEEHDGKIHGKTLMGFKTENTGEEKKVTNEAPDVNGYEYSNNDSFSDKEKNPPDNSKADNNSSDNMETANSDFDEYYYSFAYNAAYDKFGNDCNIDFDSAELVRDNEYNVSAIFFDAENENTRFLIKVELEKIENDEFVIKTDENGEKLVYIVYFD